MLELKTKQALAKEAHTLARGQKLVRYRNMLYVPADFETKETAVAPEADRTIWLPRDREQIRQYAADEFDTLFVSEAELSSFYFMVSQNAEQIRTTVTDLLIRTPEGLRRLTEMGTLADPTGEFVPNTILPMLNNDPKDKKRITDLIDEWLNSEEERTSLLHHLATCLAPGYSAVKYMLLLGEGRNGKSTLLKMMQALFGNENISHVTRQAMAEQSAVVTELNGKLINIVFDGKSEYLKDSATEKTLVAGEVAPIRRLYESVITPVQTNALFIEGLNKEPKSTDKSTALQKRLVRFQFPNSYPLNTKFEKALLVEKMLGALLSVLIDHYVREDDLAEKLQPTSKAIEMQIEHMYANSLGLQFIKYVHDTGTLGLASILGVSVENVVQLWHSWRLKENDMASWAAPDVLAQLNPLLESERRSVRTNSGPRKIRVFTSLKAEARAFIDSMEGDVSDVDLEEMVGD